MILAGPPIRLVAHPFTPFTSQVVNVFNHSLTLIDVAYLEMNLASLALASSSICYAEPRHKARRLVGSNKGCDPVGVCRWELEQLGLGGGRASQSSACL